MIRPATEADILHIVELGRLLHQESDEYRGISYDEEKVAETMRGLMDGGGVVFLYEQGGQIRGGLAGTIGEFWFSREKVAGDFSLFVDPEYRNGMIAIRLVLAFQSWSKLLGARRMNMGITTGINEEGTARLYQSLGMRRNGSLFSKDL
jgi:GNAT superfamily N-acetyltransferase